MNIWEFPQNHQSSIVIACKGLGVTCPSQHGFSVAPKIKTYEESEYQQVSHTATANWSEKFERYELGWKHLCQLTNSGPGGWCDSKQAQLDAVGFARLERVQEGIRTNWMIDFDINMTLSDEWACIRCMIIIKSHYWHYVFVLIVMNWGHNILYFHIFITRKKASCLPDQGGSSSIMYISTRN